ncbi:hypothetical protein DSECCO2_243960 [anaerobic digester metagenome]
MKVLISMTADKIVSTILIVLIILGVSAVIYIVFNPQPKEGFTELYILGENGKAGNYPINMSASETGKVTVGIVNHEYNKTSYKLLVKSGNKTLYQKSNVTLQPNGEIEIPVEFSLTKTGNSTVEFLLYKVPDEIKVYRSVYLTVNIS